MASNSSHIKVNMGSCERCILGYFAYRDKVTIIVTLIYKIYKK